MLTEIPSISAALLRFSRHLPGRQNLESREIRQCIKICSSIIDDVIVSLRYSFLASDQKRNRTQNKVRTARVVGMTIHCYSYLFESRRVHDLPNAIHKRLVYTDTPVYAHSRGLQLTASPSCISEVASEKFDVSLLLSSFAFSIHGDNLIQRHPGTGPLAISANSVGRRTDAPWCNQWRTKNETTLRCA